jgi:predicted dehydrogenase
VASPSPRDWPVSTDGRWEHPGRPEPVDSGSHAARRVGDPVVVLSTKRSVTPAPISPGPLRVGLVGAGPWALMVHAPMFAGNPRTILASVWSRRLAAAEQAAAPYGATAHESFDRFLDDVDAVSFAVPPDVQAELAVSAAQAGKALLLEKPLALDLAAAEALADAVDSSGVPTLLLLTWRYRQDVRALLDSVSSARPIGGRGHFLTGGFLDGVFATPWRLDRGPLFDLGPHVIDLLDAALGPVVGIRAHGDPRRWVGLQLEHDTGAVSDASLTGISPVGSPRAGVEVHTSEGVFDVDTAAFDPAVLTTVSDEFVESAARTGTHPIDVARGLHLQRLITRAATDLEWA